jgi:hypothetical protein
MRLSQIIILLLMPIFSFAQQTQTITGTITDNASRAALTGVTVVLLSDNKIGTVTDENGFFKLQNVPLGRQSLHISYLGYEDRSVNDLIVTAGKEVNLNISLQESVKALKDVTITYNKSKDKTKTINEMAQVSARSFNVDETKKYAGALGDPSRMAANFAGVVAGNDSRNDIVVRGNSPNGMLWQLEGLNIPNPNHFGALNSTGGPVSMLNNNTLDKSDFMASAFPAQYGNALAGVFDLHLRDGNREKNEFVGQVGFNGFEAGAEGPLGKKNTSYLINYRYSTLGVFKALGLDLGTGSATPIYQDLNFKITTKINNKAKLSVFGIEGNSKADFLGREIDTNKLDMYGGDPYKNMRAKYGSSINGAYFDYQFNEKTSARFTIGYSATLEDFAADSINYITNTDRRSQDARFTTRKLSTLLTFYHKMNTKNSFQAGLIHDYTSFHLKNTVYYENNTERTYVDQNGNMGLTQTYVQWRHRFSNNLSTTAGLHAQYHSISNASALEPRMSIRYAFHRQSISVGYGLHHQTQSIYTYFVQTPTTTGVALTNQNLGFTRSHHFVATYDWNITDNTRLKIEAYYQSLSNVPVEQRATSFSTLNDGGSFAPTNVDSLVNKGTGYNYGTEFTLEHFFSKGYYYLVTASLFNSKYKGSDEVERNTAFNTGHVLNVLSGKEYKVGKKGNILSINLKTSWIGGRYLTPIDLAASQVSREAEYIESQAYSIKQDDYFRLDLKIAYRKEFKRSTLEYSLDLQNVTANKNIFNQVYDARTNRVVNNYQQGFFPVPTFRVTF